MSKTFQVTFEAHDPECLAGFWARALGYVLQPPPHLVEEDVADRIKAGATKLDSFDRQNEFWIVVQDPEGNEFCVQ